MFAQQQVIFEGSDNGWSIGIPVDELYEINDGRLDSSTLCLLDGTDDSLGVGGSVGV